MKLRPAYVLLVAALVLAINNGLTFAGITVFDSALLAELGVSVGELKFRDTVLYLVAAVVAPGVGYLVDRIGAKPALIGGTLVVAGGFAAYAHVDALRHVYLIHFCLGLALATGGLMVSVILVSQWFGAWRGRALGILVSGSSLGNALLPKLNAWLIDAFGWREAFLWTALLPMLLLPLLLLLPRHPPWKSAAAAAGPEATAAPPGQASMSYAQALRAPQFWLLGVVAFVTFYAFMGTTANVVLHMQRDLGLPLESAANSLSILFMSAIVTKLGGGWLADRYGPRYVLIGCLLVMMAGTGTLTLMSASTVFTGVLLLGLGWGALYTMVHLLPSRLFGLEALGKIMGTLIIFETMGGASGPFGVGRGYDASGSYLASFAIVTGMLAVALVAALLLRPPRQRAHGDGQ
ncbi:MAG: MFS transporter [Xanthomonadales bacterium]|uniref:MFS transporter n=1 Tax=Hydrogenophaga sp. TaxID=1904254 RepID=UPI00169B2F24|nr:MFS transporter [Hydrogenophaga sp.]NIM69017.1 MFS transporter [Xanthomonadales bacterium]NIN58316.1 MFS transporter [Xanthomonadales bacterium]NIN73661.1 MFS transporter [Xanthomonadales bacterium]NIO14446.1 MFS transporter [Xanthomonadales bacterium]NIP10709.1 MFS transporter [Xanthomonadales bacterium]